MPAPKGSSREAQRRLCAGQISHVSLLQHTDRSSQCSLLYEGQVHARRAGREKRGRERVKEWEKKLEPKPLLSFLFSHFPLVSHVFPSLSLPSYTPPFLSLSPQRNPVSPLGLELFEGDPELYCSLPLLSSLSSLYPPPSAPTPQPSGGLDPAQPRAAVLQIQARA